MRVSILLFTFAALTALPASAQDKPDPLKRAYAVSPTEAYQAIGRAIASKGWAITYSDKDLCIITFKVKDGLTVMGSEAATAVCEASGDDTLVTIKRGPKEWLGGRQDRKFAERVFTEIERAGLKQRETK